VLRFASSEMFVAGSPGKETLFLSRLRAQETFWGTMFPQQCLLVCEGLEVNEVKGRKV